MNTSPEALSLRLFGMVLAGSVVFLLGTGLMMGWSP